jgi:hypothetical protein
MGCDEIQGYFLARPLTASDMTAWLETFDESSIPPPVRLLRDPAKPATTFSEGQAV